MNLISYNKNFLTHILLNEFEQKIITHSKKLQISYHLYTDVLNIKHIMDEMIFFIDNTDRM
jgi:hypothetical protein